ncbi:MAG: VWA domain-containing protein [Gemmatimonadaceae bacterium]|nr:VWA domain-containing protein [Gemmatimonadaceae bacterium]
MGFLVPAFLAGLVAVGVPVLMHLRDRNEETPTRFPSLMFLVRLPIRTSDRRRITDWPLLLLRAAAVALLVAAFARPYFGRVSAVDPGARTRAVVLVLDRSLSMSHGSTWAAALDSARAVLDGLRAGDHVALVTFDDEASVAQGWTTDHGSLRAVLDAITPGPRGTRMGAALRAARGLLSTAPPAAPEVVLVSDLQRSGLAGTAGLEWPQDAPLRTVVVAAARRPNVAISDVEARRVSSDGRASLQVQARLVAHELDASRALRATLVLGGREVATRELTLAAGGERGVVFDPVPAPAGLVRGEVRLTADELPGDDRFAFTVAAEDAIRVVALLPGNLDRDELLFFERALSIGRSPEVRVERRNAALDAATLDRAAMVVLWDVPAPGDEALANWVRAGGGLVHYVGGRVAARRAALAFGAATAVGLADRRAAGGGVLGEHRGDHPLFTPFRTTPAALGAPRFWSYARLEPAAGSDVLARFDDGAAAVLERAEGEGRVIVSALPLDAREADLVLQPAFLPLVRRLALYGSGHEGAPAARRTGEAWVPRGVRRSPVVVAPDGALIRPEDGAASVMLEQPGIYAAYEGRVDGAPRAIVAANAPAEESDLTQADPRELLLGASEGSAVGVAESAQAAALELETRQRGWRLLLLGALLCLLAETWLSSRGWRAQARRASIEQLQGEVT